MFFLYTQIKAHFPLCLNYESPFNLSKKTQFCISLQLNAIKIYIQHFYLHGINNWNCFNNHPHRLNSFLFIFWAGIVCVCVCWGELTMLYFKTIAVGLSWWYKHFMYIQYVVRVLIVFCKNFNVRVRNFTQGAMIV